MNGTDRGVHACALQDAHHFGNAFGRQVGEFAVVYRHVGFAPGTVLRQCGAGHLTQHTGRDLLHAGVMGGARDFVLLISF
jgi:hypothetical protein